MTGVLRFINDFCLIDAVCIVLFLSLYSKIPKIKKKCWTIRTCNYQVGCRTGTSFIADKITQQNLVCNPFFEIFWNLLSSIFTRVSGSILIIFWRYILCRKKMQKTENICEVIMMRQAGIYHTKSSCPKIGTCAFVSYECKKNKQFRKSKWGESYG